MHFFVVGVYFFVFLIFLVCVLVVWKTARTPNKNFVFGVTLPSCALDDPEVARAKTQFKRLCLVWGTVFTLSFLPAPALLFLLPGHLALSVVYLMIWALGIAIYSANRPYRDVRRHLRAVKQENGWYYGVVQEATVDTKASLLKNKATAPAWLFIPAAVLPFLLLWTMNGRLKAAAMIAAVSSIALKGLFFWLYLLAKRLKTEIWSENSEINVAVNCERQRVWSQFWILTAYLDSASCVVSWTLFSLPHTGVYLFMSVLTLSAFAEIVLILYSFNCIHHVRDEFTSLDQKPIMTDDDEFWRDSWIAGEVYCNPNDRSVMVEKRIGVGMMPNVATKKGWAFCYGGLIFAVLLIAGLSVFFLMFDFSTTTLQIDSASQTVAVNTFLYGTKFPESSITSISLVGSIPPASRTNGSDDGHYAGGHFNVDGYGPSLLYVYENEPPYILIRLTNGTVFYNEKAKQETLSVYSRLKNEIKLKTETK